MELLIFLSLIITIPFALIYFFRADYFKLSLVSFLVVLVIALFYWSFDGMDSEGFNLIKKGFFKSDFGRVFFHAFLNALQFTLVLSSFLSIYYILKEKNYLENLREMLKPFFGDRVYCAHIIGVGINNLFLALSGFGINFGIAIPLLLMVGIGVSEALAIVILGSLMGNLFAVFGTPIIAGLEILSFIPFLNDSPSYIVENSVKYAINYHLIPSLALGFGITAIALTSQKNLKNIKKYIHFTIMSWAVFNGALWMTNQFSGNVLPGFVAGLLTTSTLLLYVGIKNKICLGSSLNRKAIVGLGIYIIIFVVLLIMSARETRNFLSQYVVSATFSVDKNIGNREITANYVETHEILAFPGLALIMISITIAFLYGMSSDSIMKIASVSVAFFATAFLIYSSVLIMIITDSNPLNKKGIFQDIGFRFSTYGYIFFPVSVPITAFIGGFLSQSATISNTLYIGHNLELAYLRNFDNTKLTGLHLLGSSVGGGISVMMLSFVVFFYEGISKLTNEDKKKLYSYVFFTVFAYLLILILEIGFLS